jgi:hypothetical protein
MRKNKTANKPRQPRTPNLSPLSHRLFLLKAYLFGVFVYDKKKLRVNPRAGAGKISIMKIKHLWFVLVLPWLGLAHSAPAAEANLATTAKPTLSITNLTAGQSLSTNGFTIQGTAAGKAGVTNVLYALNQGAWTNASTANTWTNWSATLTLVPGTNTFSAYAVDNSGSHSKTNTVKFVYVVLTTITVRTNGPGSISPNYDGVPLQIGNTYSMTATSAVAGFGLRTWTGSSNTNGATVQFVMASNLTFVANIGDLAKPVIAVTSVVTNTGGVPTSLIISGTATDNVAVTNVLYSLNHADWTNATTGNSWSNWTVQVTMVPGTNTVSLRAVDSSGNQATTTNAVKIFYLATAVLTVRTNGTGKISPAYDGAQLNLGVGYSITAKGTKSGIGLVSWTDGHGRFLANTATLKFLMSSNLTLIANMGDVVLPTVNVSSTTTNTDGIANHFVVHGVAKDNVAVTNVFYHLNTDAWAPASTTNNWTNWTANVTLALGANIFYVYSMDTTSNNSYVVSAQIDYNSISGLSGTAYFFGTNNVAPLNVAFGKSTFSQFTLDTNHVNAVGSYTYTASGSGGKLKLKYTGPPSATNQGSQTLVLTPSITPSIVYFTNNTTTDYGAIQFSPVSNLALADVSGHTIWSFDNQQADGSGVFFQNGKYTSQPLNTSATNAGSYTYTQYSRVGALFKLTDPNGASYVLANFAATNLGLYYSEDYDSSGKTNGTEAGLFQVDAQQTDWNAPLTVSNQIIQISSTDGTFNEDFGLNTYSQDTLTNNYDNDVGSYTYIRATTNISLLNLTVTEPPMLAGGQSTGWLIFSNNNAGLLLNRDATVSSFIVTTATNLTPNSITNQYVTLSNDTSTNYYAFTDNGVLYYWFQEIQYYFPVGTYTYNLFSPGGAMIYLDINSYLLPERDWLQLNFNASGAGAFYKSEFDSNTNFFGIQKGNFILLNLQ